MGDRSSDSDPIVNKHEVYYIQEVTRMNWQELISTILKHGHDDGKNWSLRRLADAVPMSYSALQRLATGETTEPKYSEGERLKTIHGSIENA